MFVDFSWLFVQFFTVFSKFFRYTQKTSWVLMQQWTLKFVYKSEWFWGSFWVKFNFLFQKDFKGFWKIVKNKKYKFVQKISKFLRNFFFYYIDSQTIVANKIFKTIQKLRFSTSSFELTFKIHDYSHLYFYMRSRKSRECIIMSDIRAVIC